MRIPRSALILLLYLCLSVPACLYLRYKVVPSLFGGRAAAHELSDADAFARLLDAYGASLDRVIASRVSPAVYSENLPPNLGSLVSEGKASLFISLVLPNVLRVNEEIRATRKEMLSLLAKRDRFQRLTAKEQWWLNRLARQYGCNPDDADELRLRVDTVPVALALAQAITESGWGTSRFAQTGNALYGQHLSGNSTGEYILSRNGSVKMAAFPSIYDATRSYMHTLNKVRAYTDLRRQRADLRARGIKVTGGELAGELTRYSEIGARYTSDLRYIITRYELERLNGVKLARWDNGRVVRFER